MEGDAAVGWVGGALSEECGGRDGAARYQPLEPFPAVLSACGGSGRYGRTPLHDAAFGGHAGAASALLLRGANVSLPATARRRSPPATPPPPSPLVLSGHAASRTPY
jgi:hypothetical protein